MSAAAQAVFGSGTVKASEWLGRWLHELRHGDPDQVLAALRALPLDAAGGPTTAANNRDKVLSYFETRRSQIDYAKFVAPGFPIGSGMVESANKLVVEARLKGSGMHWARANVNPPLALRTALRSGRWQTVWPLVWKILCDRPRKSRKVIPEPACQSNPTPLPPVLAPPAPRPKSPPAIKLEKKSMIQNGRPAKDHPWNASARTKDWPTTSTIS